jgi:hypothetical protein
VTVFYFFLIIGGFMALIKFGAGVSEMRGKEGGVIYSRNAYGSYIKTKVSPINPQTTNQMTQRTLMGNLSQTWSTLDAGEKGSWDNLGSQVTRVNRFGDNTTYTGFSIYCKLNRNIVLSGGAALDEAPAIPEIPVLALSSFTPTVAAMELAFTPTPIPTGFKLFIYATNNILTGRRFVKNYYRLTQKIAAAQTSPQTIQTSWSTYFGNDRVVGAQIFIKAKLVHSATGFEGVPALIDSTVAA